MTVLTTAIDVTYDGSDIVVDYVIPFPFLEDTHILVYKIASGLETLLTRGVDYTQYGAGTYTGGAIKLTVPAGAANDIRIERVLPLIQPTQLRNHGIFSPETHEKSFDRLTMLVQQLDDLIQWLITQVNNLTVPYDIYFFVPDAFIAPAELMIAKITRNVTFLAGLSDSEAYLKIAGSTQTVISIKKNTVEVGTITFAAASNVGAFSFASQVSLVNGDTLSFECVEAGSGAGDLSVTLAGTRS